MPSRMALPSLRKNEEWGMSRLSPHFVPPHFVPRILSPHFVPAFSSPKDLKNSIANMKGWHGLKSSISQWDAGVFDPQDPQNIANWENIQKQTPFIPVSSDFKNVSGLGAVTGSGGNVYFRPGWSFSFFHGVGGIKPENVFHESMHVLTGKGDYRLAEQLGLPEGQRESQYINPLLKKKGCL